MVKLNCLSEDRLQDIFCIFHLSVFLGVVRGRLSMLDLILWYNSLHYFDCELCALIYNYLPRHPKPSEDILKKEIYHCSLKKNIRPWLLPTSLHNWWKPICISLSWMQERWAPQDLIHTSQKVWLIFMFKEAFHLSKLVFPFSDKHHNLKQTF